MPPASLLRKPFPWVCRLISWETKSAPVKSNRPYAHVNNANRCSQGMDSLYQFWDLLSRSANLAGSSHRLILGCYDSSIVH